MTIDEIINQLKDLENQVTQWQRTASSSLEPNTDAELENFSRIQEHLNQLLTLLQHQPKDARDKASPHLTRFQHTVQSYYNTMMKDVNRLQNQISNLQNHAKGVKSYMKK